MEQNFEEFYKKSIYKIEEGVKKLHGENEQSLQKLSATFRRYDLLDYIDYPIIKKN